jgi:hypothetical protein
MWWLERVKVQLCAGRVLSEYGRRVYDEGGEYMDDVGCAGV